MIKLLLFISLGAIWIMKFSERICSDNGSMQKGLPNINISQKNQCI